MRDAYDMESMVSDVLAVLDATGTDRAHFLGYSLGGRVGFSLAATHPERMLSFISAAGAPRARSGSFDRVFFPGCIEVLEADGMTGFLTAWERAGATVDANTRAALLRNDARALAAYMRQSQDDPGVPDAAVAGIDLPTLLLVGSKDDERLDAAKDAVRMMPSATLRLLPGATHGETLQHPDALPAVREFLVRQPVGLRYNARVYARATDVSLLSSDIEAVGRPKSVAIPMLQNSTPRETAVRERPGCPRFCVRRRVASSL